MNIWVGQKKIYEEKLYGLVDKFSVLEFYLDNFFVGEYREFKILYEFLNCIFYFLEF